MVFEFVGNQYVVGDVNGNTCKSESTKTCDVLFFPSFLLTTFVIHFPFQHAAGVAALYLEKDPTMTPAQVREAMLSGGISGVVNDPGSGSPNLLLTTQELIATTPPPTPNPTLAPTLAPTATPAAYSTSPPGTTPPATSSPATSAGRSSTPSPTQSPSAAPISCNKFLGSCEGGGDCCSGSCWFVGWERYDISPFCSPEYNW